MAIIYGRINNYRIGIRTQASRECLVQFEQADLTAASIGQKVMWKQGNVEHAGRIVGLHGRNGVVRVRFNRGVPGQALGTMVELTK